MGKLRPSAGFSLIELVVVVSIAAIVLAMLIPGIRQATDSFTLRKATSMLIAELRTAQALSTSDQVDVMFEFYTNGSSAPGGLRYWVREPGTTTWFEVRRVEDPEWPAIVHMAGGSGFPGCSTPADPGHHCTVFKSLGYLTDGGEVKIRARSGGPEWEVAVNAATGRVTINR